MTYDASTFLGERLPRKKLDFLWFSCFADCNLCYLFHRENLASSYKCSNVMQRMRQDKHFVSVKSTTWMVPCHLKEIYICLALIKQEILCDLCFPPKVYILEVKVLAP